MDKMTACCAETEWFSDSYTVLDTLIGFVFYTWGLRAARLQSRNLQNYTAFKNPMCSQTACIGTCSGKANR